MYYRIVNGYRKTGYMRFLVQLKGFDLKGNRIAYYLKINPVSMRKKGIHRLKFPLRPICIRPVYLLGYYVLLAILQYKIFQFAANTNTFHYISFNSTLHLQYIY